MAGLFSKVARFASSPQGRAALDKAKAAANDPKNRAKVEELVGKAKQKADSVLGDKGQQRDGTTAEQAGPAKPTGGTAPGGTAPGSTTPGSTPSGSRDEGDRPTGT